MIEALNVSMHFPKRVSMRELLLNPFKKREVFRAIDNVSFYINKGDRVAFLGRNGAGKTTLLKAVGGLLYPVEGSVLIDNYDTVTQNSAARRKVGFVLNEERSFYWRLTGEQNLSFFGSLDNLCGDKLHEKIDELVQMVGLGSSIHKQVATYSSGMKQKLAIARGLLADPEVLILDEPTRTLDPQSVIDIKRLISDKVYQNGGRTLLIATHRFEEVEELCNKVCIIQKGRMVAFELLQDIIQSSGTLSEFYHNYANTNV